MSVLEEFVGREVELGELERAWDRARAGLPQWMLLLGDSGLGKTRLVHEFYRRRVKRDGDQDYWPAQLDANPATLRVNPDLGARIRQLDEMPWFWWGLRWPPRESRIGSRDYCALLEQEAQTALAIHAAPRRKAQAREAHTRDLGKSSALVLTGQVVGTTVLGPIWSTGKTLIELAAGTARWAQLSRGLYEIDPVETIDRERRDGETATRDFLVSMLDGAAPFKEPRPVIMVLDDAQWADARTLAFMRDLFADARRFGWPLLVLATCWETEWKQQRAEADAGTTNGPPVTLAGLLSRLERFSPSVAGPGGAGGEHCHLIRLAKFQDRFLLRPLIKRVFPGLAAANQAYLLAQADGNPRILAELLRLLEEQATAEWFVRGDRRANLSALGAERLKALPTQYEGMVLQRIRRLEEQSPESYRVLMLAAAQGFRFYGQLVSDVGVEMGCLAADTVLPHLQRADTPDNWITLLPGDTHPGQFKEHLAWCQLARSSRENWPRAGVHLRRRLLELLGATAALDTQSAVGYLEMLADHLRAPDAVAAEQAQWPRVVGRLVNVLQVRGAHGAAAERAMELVKSCPMSGRAWLNQLDGADWLPMGYALFEARAFNEVESLAGWVMDPAGGTIEIGPRVAWLELRARAAHLRERAADAVAWWDQAISQAVAPDSPFGADDVLRLRLGMADSHYQADGRKIAAKLYEAIAESVPAAGLRGLPTSRLLIIGLAWEGLALSRYDAGEMEEAMYVMGRGCSVLTQCESRVDAGVEVKQARIACLRMLGRWRLRQIGGVATEAETVLRQAVELQQELLRRVGPSTRGLNDLAVAQTWLARAINVRSSSEALQMVEGALAVREEVLLRTGERTDIRRGLAITLYCRGQILLNLGRATEAVGDFERVCELRRAVVGAGKDAGNRLLADQRMLVHGCRLGAQSLRQAGNMELARARLDEALQVNRLNLRRLAREAEDLRSAYQIWEEFGWLELAARHRSRANRCFRQAMGWLARLEKRYGLGKAGEQDRARLGQALSNLHQTAAHNS